MCDAHSPFWRHTVQTAHLNHRCDECPFPIIRGEQYHSIRGKWDGEFSVCRAHHLCHELAAQVSLDDGCRMLGELRSVVGEVRLTPTQAQWAATIFGCPIEKFRQGEEP